MEVFIECDTALFTEYFIALLVGYFVDLLLFWNKERHSVF